MCGDLMETHAHVDLLLSPERRTSENGVRQSREACIGTRAGVAEYPQKLKHPTAARQAELTLGRRQPVAWKKCRRDLDRVGVRARRRVLDLRGVSELDGYGMPQDVAKAPFAIPCAVEKAVIPSYENADHSAVRCLSEVEDARHL